MPHTMRDWLASLSEEELASIIDNAADAGAPIRSLDELAQRLQHPGTVVRALQSGPLPRIQLLEAVTALGLTLDPVSLRMVLDTGGRSEEDHQAQIEHWLADAMSVALLWIDEDGLHLNPAAHQVLPYPLADSPSLAGELPELTVDQLRRIATAWGVSPAGRKAELVARLSVTLDQQLIRRLLSEAPDGVLDTLTTEVTHAIELAQQGGLAEEAQQRYIRSILGPGGREAFARRQELVRWLLEHGLAIGSPYDALSTEVPTEVLLALAPTAFRFPFDPEPPVVATAPVPDQQAGRSAAAAIAQFLASATATVEATTRRPLTANKTGGIGARELSRLAKEVGAETATARLAVATAAYAEVLDVLDDGTLGGSPSVEDWRRQAPARRAFSLIQSWLHLTLPPSWDRDAEGAHQGLLSPKVPSTGVPLGLVCCLLAAAHPGEGLTSAADVRAVIGWEHPTADLPPGTVERAWAEAHELGLLAEGRLSTIGEAVLEQDEERALAALSAMLPEVTSQALFGSDQTVMVPGSPRPDVVDVLDAVAEREARGAANTWRITGASVRSALDTGYQAEELLTALRTIAGKELPQAIEYLIGDVARKHGHLGVRAAAAVVTSEDEALLAEVVATRGLRRLGLSLVAPTVAVSAEPVGEVLRALRAAGFLPIEVDDGGAPLVQVRHLSLAGEQAEAHEPAELDELSEGADAADLAAIEQLAPSRPSGLAEREDPQEIAQRLLTGGDTDLAPVSGLEQMLTNLARRLSAAEVHELADATEHGRPVVIVYLSGTGSTSRRMVSGLLVDGPHLLAYCHERQDERTFRLDRILSVEPVG